VIRRLVGQLYGTTTLGDCVVAARHLAARRELVRGPAIIQYERAFAAAIGVRHAYSFAAGRVAMFGLLRAFGVGAGDEVLLQVPTHVVVVNAIRYTGARPLFVDCRLTDYNIDLEHAEQLVTQRTKVLLLQHTFGIPADLDAAVAFARDHDLILIEDCVHALGSEYEGRRLGSFGDAAFFSTEETKTISSTMGGVAVTDDARVAARVAEFQSRCAWPARAEASRHLLKLVAYHLAAQPYVHPYTHPVYSALGRTSARLAPPATHADEQRGLRPKRYEVRLSNAQAAVALRQLERLEHNVAHRRAVARAYEEQLRDLGVRTPTPPDKANPAYLRFPLWVDDPVSLAKAAESRAILGRWGSSVIGEALDPAELGYRAGSCPNTELVNGHLVNLPTHPRVAEADVQAIVAAVRASVSKADGALDDAAQPAVGARER
jgi:perosamine synthetase